MLPLLSPFPNILTLRKENLLWDFFIMNSSM